MVSSLISEFLDHLLHILHQGGIGILFQIVDLGGNLGEKISYRVYDLRELLDLIFSRHCDGGFCHKDSIN